jgi:peptidyl-prolyl cis-trans isomerase C
MYRASHILIGYQGAMRYTGPRTQEEAMFETARIRNEIAQGVITFEDAAVKYSDCPSKQNQGNLGTFKPSTMDQDFIAFIDTLQVSEISGVCPTVYGYHIIRKN